MTHLNCATHGKQKETFVCRHIIETLGDHEPRGFWWSVEEGIYEAICTACNEMESAEFAAMMDENITALCYGCFRHAGEINGIILE